MTICWNIVIWDKDTAGFIKRPMIFIHEEAAVYGFITLIVTKIREFFDVRNREMVCLLEVIMKATILI